MSKSMIARACYTLEFKHDVVRLVESGQSQAAMADDASNA